MKMVFEIAVFPLKIQVNSYPPLLIIVPEFSEKSPWTPHFQSVDFSIAKIPVIETPRILNKAKRY